MKSNELDGVRILVVDDNYMIASNLAEALGSAGARIVGVLGTLEDATVFVASRHAEVEIALLDVNLAGVMSYPVADILVRHDVPFIFMTGYDTASMEAAYRDFPVCMKPFGFQTVVSTIRRVLDGRTPPPDRESRDRESPDQASPDQEPN